VAPHVSVVVPARNEAADIQACIRSILAQQVEAELEVIVVDGSSSDGTPELARSAGAVVVPNPDRTTPMALNRGLAAAAGDVLIRFDAHSEMGDGYIAACLRGLAQESGAVNVGGWCEVRGRTAWGAAVAATLSSPLGVGNARLWRRPRSSARVDVETVPFGCFPIEALRSVGGWRGDLVRNQDFELNYRLREAGGRVVFDPAIRFVYRPRETLGGLWSQYSQFGRWKAIVLAETPASLKPRQLAPLGLLATSAAAVRGPFRRQARAALGAYGLAVAALAVRSRNWRTAPVVVTIHVAWAAGFAATVARLVRHHFRPNSLEEGRRLPACATASPPISSPSPRG
jgi:succinoglycan biosynthesis protein ExoA